MDLESLFRTREVEEEIIYFNDIIIESSTEGAGHIISSTTIRFSYSYCDEVDFHSSLLIDGKVTKENFIIIFSIGMYVSEDLSSQLICLISIGASFRGIGWPSVQQILLFEKMQQNIFRARIRKN